MVVAYFKCCLALEARRRSVNLFGNLAHVLTEFLSDHNWLMSGIMLSYGVDDRGFQSRQGLEIFLLTAVSRLALVPV
jgi:hypothetical protein